jgi:serine phosphatase RsbU (regulator of sigma subunit)
MNPAGEEFGEERLIPLLLETVSARPETLRQRIMAVVAAFADGAFQDDATLLIASISA